MEPDLIRTIGSSVIERAKDKVLARLSLPLHILMNAHEIDLFKGQAPSLPIDQPVGMLAMIKAHTSTPIDELLSLILANLSISRVIEDVVLITDVHLNMKQSIDQSIEIFLFSLE